MVSEGPGGLCLGLLDQEDGVLALFIIQISLQRFHYKDFIFHNSNNNYSDY
jgi:hypothetical protein